MTGVVFEFHDLYFGASVGYKDGEKIQRFAERYGGVMMGMGTTGTEVRPTYIENAIPDSGYGAIRLNAGLVGNATPTAWLEAAANTTAQTALAATAFTYVLIIRVPTTTINFATIISKVASGSNGSWVAVNTFPTTSNGQVRTFNGGAASGDIRDGNFHIITISENGANQRMTVDGGTVITSAAGPTGRADSGVPLRIGALAALYGGQIDIAYVAVLDHATDATEEALIYSELNRDIMLGQNRSILYIGDSITFGSASSTDAQSATYLATEAVGTALGETWERVNAGVSGSATRNWLPGGTNYNAAVALGKAARCRMGHVMLGTNDTEDSFLEPAATYESNLRLLRAGLFTDLPCLTNVVFSYPCTAWTGGSHGGDALMQQYQDKLDLLHDDARYPVGDKAMYPLFVGSATYLSGDLLHPNNLGHSTMGAAWGAILATVISGKVGGGRISADVLTSDSAAIISNIDPVCYVSPAATIVSCGAQYSTNGGGAWTAATWTATSRNIYSGKASGLPDNTTHVRRSATDSLGNTGYSPAVAVSLPAAGGGGGGSTTEGEPEMGENPEVELVEDDDPMEIAAAGEAGRLYLMTNEPVMLCYSASGDTVARGDNAFPYTPPFTTFNVATGKKLSAWSLGGTAKMIVVK